MSRPIDEKITPQELHEKLAEGMSMTAIAAAAGVSLRALYNLQKRNGVSNVTARGGEHRAPVPKLQALDVPRLPSGKLNADELLKRREAEFERRKEYEEARKLIPVKVRENLPIGILWFGDPHVDDPGSDIKALKRDIGLCKSTDGLYAASIGDNQNHWIGRLSHLWGSQEVTAEQAWTLVEWFMNELRDEWILLQNGNHDGWANDSDPLKWIQRQTRAIVDYDEIKVSFNFPNGQKIRVASRHNWPGNSIWNPNHGQLRAGRLQTWAHLIIGGHKHSGGDQSFYVEAADIVTRAIQLGAYKIYDSYSKEIGFIKTQIAPSALVIFNPLSKSKAGLTQVFYDTEDGADYLKFMRKKYARFA